MTQTIAADEFTARFQALSEQVTASGEAIVVEDGDRPTVVLISSAAFEELEELRDERRRNALLAELRAIRADVQAANRGITEEEADAIADRFSREIIDDMVASGRAVFERDQRP